MPFKKTSVAITSTALALITSTVCVDAAVLYQPGYVGQTAAVPPKTFDTFVPSNNPQSSSSNKENTQSDSAIRADEMLALNTSRVNIANTQLVLNYPYRAVGSLMTISGDVVTNCTASLIGPSLLVTAAHCVARHGDGYFGDHFFTPAQGFPLVEPFGIWKVVEKKVPETFLSGDSLCMGLSSACQDDIAVLRIETKSNRLGERFSLGEKIGWLGFGLEGFGFIEEGPLSLAAITHLGYSPRYDGGVEMQRTDTLALYEAQLDQVSLRAPLQLLGGGGPLIVNIGEPASITGEDSQRDATPNTIIAVGSREDGSGEVLASRFSQENFKNLIDAFCVTDPAHCYLTDEPAKPDITITLEEPIEGGVYSGIGNLRGWALYQFPLVKTEVSIDDEPFFQVPYGGQRADVGAAFPEVPNSFSSGFGLAFSYGELTPGPHTIRVRATSITGEQGEVSSQFVVQRFHKSFIAAEDIVSLDRSVTIPSGDSLKLDGVDIDGVLYDLQLKWNTATQDFDITSIVRD